MQASQREVCAGKVRPTEISFAQIGAAQMSAVQINGVQVGMAQISLREINQRLAGVDEARLVEKLEQDTFAVLADAPDDGEGAGASHFANTAARLRLFQPLVEKQIRHMGEVSFQRGLLLLVLGDLEIGLVLLSRRRAAGAGLLDVEPDAAARQDDRQDEQLEPIPKSVAPKAGPAPVEHISTDDSQQEDQ